MKEHAFGAWNSTWLWDGGEDNFASAPRSFAAPDYFQGHCAHRSSVAF